MQLLSNELQERYKRHLLLEGVGSAGQRKLLQSSVLIVGLGGLGSPIALYLAAAGVGTLGLADGDKVELSNLQRQILHFTPDIGCAKTESAAEKLIRLNPDVEVRTYPKIASEKDLEAIVSSYDFIVDATDNFRARFLLNDVCVRLMIPFSHGGISKFYGQTMTVIPGHSCCYRCIFGSLEEQACDIAQEEGLFGAIAGTLGSVQAAETLKYLTNTGELLTDRLLTFDALAMRFRCIDLHKQAGCAVCG